MTGRKAKEPTGETEVVVRFENGDEIRGEEKKKILKALEINRKQKALEKQMDDLKTDLKSSYAKKGAIVIGEDFKMQVVPKETVAIDDPEALKIALGDDKFSAAVEVETTYKPTKWLKEHLNSDISAQMRLASKCVQIKETLALEFRPVN